ncbi:MAG TPA: YccF domain-containing protein [Thermoanaerobaculia bacterium]|nr:YccF domain-containing protein [Thermoanaerobaculia bacterium]
MRTIGNLIWLVCGGLLMGLAWWAAGLVAFVSIVGIPWGRACFVIGELCFLPFGRSVADRRVVTGKADIGTGALGMIGNVIWFVLAGLWLAIGHLASAVLCFVTILGIPFGLQHLKLAEIALAPIGKTVVLRR